MGGTFFKRECGSDPKKLVWWNAGEAFPSLGIGHFIWYPTGAIKSYQETFPALVQFLKNNGIIIPQWLSEAHGCPWTNKAEMDSDNRKAELTQLLQSSADLQAAFIVNRFNEELVIAAKNLNRTDLQKIIDLACNPIGMFALIDYAHFKGFGANTSEQYKSQGWGLFDVIASMSGSTVKDFQDSARTVLRRRVENASSEKKEHEKRWLTGWLNRINQYV